MSSIQTCDCDSIYMQLKGLDLLNRDPEKAKLDIQFDTRSFTFLTTNPTRCVYHQLGSPAGHRAHHGLEEGLRDPAKIVRGKRAHTYIRTYVHTYIHTYIHTSCMHACTT